MEVKSFANRTGRTRTQQLVTDALLAAICCCSRIHVDPHR